MPIHLILNHSEIFRWPIEYKGMLLMLFAWVVEQEKKGNLTYTGVFPIPRRKFAAFCGPNVSHDTSRRFLEKCMSLGLIERVDPPYEQKEIHIRFCNSVVYDFLFPELFITPPNNEDKKNTLFQKSHWKNPILTQSEAHKEIDASGSDLEGYIRSFDESQPGGRTIQDFFCVLSDLYNTLSRSIYNINPHIHIAAAKTKAKRKNLKKGKGAAAADAAPLLNFGEFVQLTAAQFEELGSLWGCKVRDDLIEQLNEYIGSKGVKYKSHYHTLFSFKRRHDKQEPYRPTTSTKHKETLLKQVGNFDEYFEDMLKEDI